MLLLASAVALSALPAPAVLADAVLGDVTMSDGSDASAQAMAEDSSAQGNSAAAESSDDTLISEVVPPEEGFVERAARAFTDSDLVFVRRFSNAPCFAVAFLGGTHYGDATVSEGAARDRGQKYQVSSTSQYAGVPFYSLNAAWRCWVSTFPTRTSGGERRGFLGNERLNAAGFVSGRPRRQVIAALVPFYNHSSLGERGKDY